MQFLKTLFWMIVAVSIAIFASHNWRDVTIDLWGPLQADIKLPVLLALMVIAGWLPTWLIMRGRLWRARRKAMTVEAPPSVAATSDNAPRAQQPVPVEPIP